MASANKQDKVLDIPLEPTTELSSAPDFVEIEHRILKFWKSGGYFEKLLQKNSNGPVFRFLDGPITANSPMGVHHAWGRTLKDVFLRYKAMRGFTSHWQNGFDSQGLWVEVEVEKELGFKNKKDIESFGLERFAGKCKERVKKFSEIITGQSIRLGQWMDWPNSYFTHTDQNIEAIWYFLKTCHNKGWIYQDLRLLPWCTRCGTSLSEHEMSGAHREMEHLSVYVKLPLMGIQTSVLVWTTTPWTLPANVALAVKPDVEYCEVHFEGEVQTIILAKDSLHILNKSRNKIIRVLKGSDLVGLNYETFFPELPSQSRIKHTIIAWDAIDPKEGTGIVHIAPGCGAEDYELSKKLELPLIRPVDESGVYGEGFGAFSGLRTEDATQPIVNNLESSGKLFRSHLYKHQYPVCWRCKNPTIFRLVQEWFIRCDEIRPRLLQETQHVKWDPKHVGKLMEDWINNMGDWNISRKRFYGLPLPFYPCNQCGEVTVLGSKQELVRHGGINAKNIPELHRPWIDSIKITCPKCGASVERITEVGDVWLDAGIVPFSTLGYFNNRADWKRFYPAEWVCEMREQVRLWFYSMLFMGVTLDNRAPYEKVTAYESVVAEDGSRFSKTGLMIHFDDAVERLGADVIRYIYCGANVGANVRFGYELGNEVRRLFLTLWNTYNFFLTYALLDHPDPRTFDFSLQDLTTVDKWLLVRTNHFVSRATIYMENYYATDVLREFDSYLSDISTFYVRVNRRRFWKNDDREDKDAAYACLYHALNTCVRIMAPIIPFLTEEMWQTAIRPLDPGAAESVHLSEWPQLTAAGLNEGLLKSVKLARRVISLALSLRNQKQLKVRQPLSTLFVMANIEMEMDLRDVSDIIKDEVNVKTLKFITRTNDLESFFLTLDFQKAGPFLKDKVQNVKSILSELSNAQMSELVLSFQSGDSIKLPGWEDVLPADLFVAGTETRSGVEMISEYDLTIALDTTLTDSLSIEGLARDLVRQIQVFRKELGLKVQDRISLGIYSQEAKLMEAASTFRAYIQKETLALDIVLSENIQNILATKNTMIDDYELRLVISKASGKDKGS